MNYPDFLQPVLARFVENAPNEVYCGEGWWKIVAACDSQLAKIDPEYTVFQIKEKFGGLRFYYSPSNPDNLATMRKIVSEFEKICWMTCEISGRHGYLMINSSGRRRVLAEEYLQQGWSRINSNTYDIN